MRRVVPADDGQRDDGAGAPRSRAYSRPKTTTPKTASPTAHAEPFVPQLPVSSRNAGSAPVTQPWTAATPPVKRARSSRPRPSRRKNSAQRKAQ